LELCAQCEMPLLEHAAFCNVCGTAARVQPKTHKPTVAAMAGGQAAPQSIVPGFDTPVGGEAQDDDATDIRPGPAAADERTQEESARRSRYYDDEEGRA
jgi:uncharacterized Zn finger protein (UPF0148 family)